MGAQPTAANSRAAAAQNLGTDCRPCAGWSRARVVAADFILKKTNSSSNAEYIDDGDEIGWFAPSSSVSALAATEAIINDGELDPTGIGYLLAAAASEKEELNAPPAQYSDYSDSDDESIVELPDPSTYIF